jgi:regulator of sigma E protease
MIITLLVFLLILSVLVLIHELGHFLVAKKFGIKVEEFGYGLPPRAWGKKIGETIYSINWLPIGGFVKLFGEDEAGAGRIAPAKGKELRAKSKKDEDRAFYSRPVWQRASVVVAGVVMNALLAFVLFYGFLSLSNFKTELPLIVDDFKFFGVNQTIKEDIYINDVAKNSPAQKAGISSMDKVVSINGRAIKNSDELINQIRMNRGKEVTIVWQDPNTGELSNAKLTPRVDPPKGQGALGISFAPVRVAVLHYETPVQKAFSGVTHTFNTTVYSLDILGKLIAQSFARRSAEPVSGAVSGPVGIYKVVEICGQSITGTEQAKCYLNLAGLLSASLALFNILPIPALDGGRFFFILIEWITGRKVNERFETAAHSIGMAILIGLILLITFKDIFQFILPR